METTMFKQTEKITMTFSNYAIVSGVIKMMRYLERQWAETLHPVLYKIILTGDKKDFWQGRRYVYIIVGWNKKIGRPIELCYDGTYNFHKREDHETNS